MNTLGYLIGWMPGSHDFVVLLSSIMLTLVQFFLALKQLNLLFIFTSDLLQLYIFSSREGDVE